MPGPEQVRRLDLEDVEVFMSLQDGFVLEHHSMTSRVYEEVTLLDWQHSLVCPREILEKPGGRRQQVVSIVKQEHRYYRDLYILVAREDGREAGYVMYQVHKGKRKDPVPSAYVEVKQIFVEPELRKRGLGKLLLDGMMQAVEGHQCQNIRLSVIDLNEAATRWYRVQGFVMIGLVWEYVGPADNSHLVAYQVMQKYSVTPQEPVTDRATFFRSEIIGEVVTITYPDGSGPFDVTIRGWIESDELHMVDSRSLSAWKGSSFTDLFDFNLALRDGRAAFHRKLSLLLRDVEMTKAVVRQAKEREKELRASKVKKDKKKSGQRRQKLSIV